MKSFAFSKEFSLAFTLRLLALIIILSIVGINLTLIQDQVRSLKRGSLDLGLMDSDEQGYAVVTWVGEEPQAMGIAAGDIVLNPEVRLENEIGAPVTLLVKSGDAPAREVTLTPISKAVPGYLLTLLRLSPRAIMHVQVSFLWISLLFTGLFSIVAFQLRLDAWLVFLVLVALSHVCALTRLNFLSSFFNFFIPSALILFFLVFPTGKFAPGWSWLLVFSPLPLTMGFTLNRLGILGPNYYGSFPFTLFGEDAVFLLIVLWGILYEYRHKFTLFQKRWVNWLCLGLILINIPSRSTLLLSLGLPKQLVDNLSWAPILYLEPFVYSVFHTLNLYIGPVTLLMVVGVVVYRYYFIFKPVERQQMKWLILGIMWIAVLLVLCYMFNLYYLSSDQHSRAVSFSHTMDGFFFLAAEGIVFCILLALLRHGLNDVDTLLNRTFIYCGLLLMAGAGYLLSTMLIDSAFGNSDDQNNQRVLVLFIALIAVTFRPARRWLQTLVEERFRSEEFDFAETFYEFAPDMRAFFTVSELAKILVEKSMEQFGITYASLYIKNRNGKLQHIKTEPAEEKKPKSVIDSQTLAKLEAGEPVFPGADSTCSLMLPLVLPRGRKPDLIGVLVLGQRLNGLGYSTAMINKLKSFSQEVAKVLYTVRLRDQGNPSPARKLTAKRAPVAR